MKVVQPLPVHSSTGRCIEDLCSRGGKAKQGMASSKGRMQHVQPAELPHNQKILMDPRCENQENSLR
ncbi:hypothetical protein F2P81_023312 [Scophthalmus maximus]|uniref:Uncharacterized protein n=1 Tax=Scophthalmus maximus TaxID=52904 RepID=A0A6A4RYV5_SCOMX|nr:hypothetical protein F2P81_023312 [Scophthalmus maximus]